ncbi:DUF2958 domain-containing protein [Niabella hibiscisoli]|nr:DUF2958 domain-containing protein [Niabella hibiscisoli]
MDKVPAAKLFIPGTGCAWLITELNRYNQSKGSGLIDLGNNNVTFGEIDIDEIVSFAVGQANHVRRDPYFIGKYPIRTYLSAAKAYGFIVEQDTLLAKWTPHRRSGPSPGS